MRKHEAAIAEHGDQLGRRLIGVAAAGQREQTGLDVFALQGGKECVRWFVTLLVTSLRRRFLDKRGRQPRNRDARGQQQKHGSRYPKGPTAEPGA